MAKVLPLAKVILFYFYLNFKSINYITSIIQSFSQLNKTELFAKFEQQFSFKIIDKNTKICYNYLDCKRRKHGNRTKSAHPVRHGYLLHRFPGPLPSGNARPRKRHARRRKQRYSRNPELHRIPRNPAFPDSRSHSALHLARNCLGNNRTKTGQKTQGSSPASITSGAQRAGKNLSHNIGLRSFFI